MAGGAEAKSSKIIGSKNNSIITLLMIAMLFKLLLLFIIPIFFKLLHIHTYAKKSKVDHGSCTLFKTYYRHIRQLTKTLLRCKMLPEVLLEEVTEIKMTRIFKSLHK